jgi:hypothetical protein
MIYNLLEHKQALLQDEDNHETITNFEHYYGKLPAEVEELQVFESYLSKFEFDYDILNIPQDLANDFNCELLLQLALGSFGTEVDFVLADNNKIDVIFKVSTIEACISKKLTELWSFQVSRLFEIFVTELLNLEYLAASDAREMEAIYAKRSIKLSAFTKMVDKIEHLKSEIKFNYHDFDDQNLMSKENTKPNENTTLTIPNELYASIQSLKTLFFKLIGEEVLEDHHVLSILIGGFIDSLNNNNEPQNIKFP